MDKITETPKNIGIKIVLAAPKEHYLYLSLLFCLFTLCSASVDTLQIVLNCKMGDLSDFGTGQIVGACLAVASVIKTATSLSVSRAAVSKVMTAYTNHGKTSSAERNSGQKTKTKVQGIAIH